MTRDDIIRMAREARLIKDWMVLCEQDSDALSRFSTLVAAAEREACAQILDRNVAVCGNNTPMRDVLTGNALAIRARGQS
jgi:hypothetical protein